jgi:hypothetical protein
LPVADEELIGLRFGEFEAEGAEDEAEFFVGEEAVFVGVKEVELVVLMVFWLRKGGDGRAYGFADAGFLLVGEFVEVFAGGDGVLDCARGGRHGESEVRLAR